MTTSAADDEIRSLIPAEATCAPRPVSCYSPCSRRASSSTQSAIYQVVCVGWTEGHTPVQQCRRAGPIRRLWGLPPALSSTHWYAKRAWVRPRGRKSDGWRHRTTAARRRTGQSTGPISLGRQLWSSHDSSGCVEIGDGRGHVGGVPHHDVRVYYESRAGEWHGEPRSDHRVRPRGRGRHLPVRACASRLPCGGRPERGRTSRPYRAPRQPDRWSMASTPGRPSNARRSALTTVRPATPAVAAMMRS